MGRYPGDVSAVAPLYLNVVTLAPGDAPFLPAGEKPAGPSGGPTAARSGVKGAVSRREDHLWTLQEMKPVSIPVTVGITDGQFTEVAGEKLAEGLQVLVGVEETKATNANGATRLRAPGGRP